MSGVLTEIRAVRLQGPEVHDPVPVREEIHAFPPQHRVLAGPRVIGGQGNRLRFTGGVAPEMLGGAALIPLGAAPLPGQPGEEECRPIRRIDAVRRLRERDRRLRARPKIQIDQLLAGQPREGIGPEEQVPFGSPVHHARRTAQERPTRRQPPARRHGVDLPRSFVFRGECQGRAVRRKGRMHLPSRVGRQPLGHASHDGHPPQIALRRKHQRVPVERRKPMVPLGLLALHRRTHPHPEHPPSDDAESRDVSDQGTTSRQSLHADGPRRFPSHRPVQKRRDRQPIRPAIAGCVDES